MGVEIAVEEGTAEEIRGEARLKSKLLRLKTLPVLGLGGLFLGVNVSGSFSEPSASITPTLCIQSSLKETLRLILGKSSDGRTAPSSSARPETAS